MGDAGKNKNERTQIPVRSDVLMAFNQEDLDNAFKMKIQEIYLVGGDFAIPADKRDVVYLKLGSPTVTVQEIPRPPFEPDGGAPVRPPAAPALIPRFTSSGSYWGSGSGSPGCGLCGYGLELI